MKNVWLEDTFCARIGYVRMSVRSWVYGALTLALTAGILAGCDTAQPEEDYAAEEGVEADGPAWVGDAADLADVIARSDLGGVGGSPMAALVTDRAHWADGYVWASDPTNASYTPSTFYSFNRTGGTIQITKPAGTTGQYKVRFSGLSAFLGAHSTVHVTGYLSDNIYCKPVSPTLVNDVVTIRCFNGTTHTAANGYFTVLVTRNYTDDAFAYASQPTGNNYRPPANGSWNPGGAITISHSGTGLYQVVFSGLGTLTGSNGGHFQVVALGTGKQHCKVGGWGGSPNLSVSVLCFTPTGSPANTKFNVFFTLPSSSLAYAWADQPSTASYTPSTFYSSNPVGEAVSITHLGTGRYSVSWTGVDPVIFDGGDVQVTAYGGGNVQCKVEGWGSASATVRCFSPNGTLADSFYDVLLGS